MPIYTYTCRSCHQTFDHLARTLSDGASACPRCGADKPVKELSSFAAPASKSSPNAAACGTCDAAPRCPHACSGGCIH